MSRDQTNELGGAANRHLGRLFWSRASDSLLPSFFRTVGGVPCMLLTF